MASGSCGAGFITTVQPTASAGAILPTMLVSGKLYGRDARHRADGLAVDVRAHEPPGASGVACTGWRRHGDADALRRVACVAVEALERDRHLHARADGGGGAGLGDDQRHEVGAELTEPVGRRLQQRGALRRPASPTTPGTPPARRGRRPAPAPTDASGASPTTSSVAGFTIGAVPASPSTSSPPIRSFHSWCCQSAIASPCSPSCRLRRRPPPATARSSRVGPELLGRQGYNLTLRQTFPAPDRGTQCSTRSSRARRWSTARGRPGVVADVGIPTAASSPSAPSTSRPRTSFDATGLRRRPRLRRPAHALRRPAAVGPDREPVEHARRHHRHRRQLRLHASRRCTTGDADYLRRMMAKVEGMPLPALEQGVDWKWETFGEFLDRFEGSIAVNAGFLVGHCAIRRYVMGDGRDRRRGHARADRRDARRAAARSLEAGALGFSFTQSSSHSDGDGQPVASRWATPDELIAHERGDRRPPRHHARGHRAGLPRPVLRRRDRAARRRSARRPTARSTGTCSPSTHASPSACRASSSAGDRAAELGGRLVALTMPVQRADEHELPQLLRHLAHPRLERRAERAGARAHRTAAGPERAPEDARAVAVARGRRVPPSRRLRRLPARRRLRAPRTRRSGAGSSRDIAAERGQSNFGTLLDIVIADELRTVLWPIPQDDDGASWELRRDVWNDPRAMIGGSDAGAHLDRMCGAPYTTRFLADCLRGRQLVSLERAVQLITSAPAALFGLRDRGVLARGRDRRRRGLRPRHRRLRRRHAGARPPRRLGPAHRRLAGHRAGARQRRPRRRGRRSPPARRPACVLRSGRDTETVTAR